MPRVTDVRAKLVGVQRVETTMGKAMTTDLMAGSRNTTYQLRKALPNPAKDEERRAHPMPLKKVEDPHYVLLYSRGVLIPGVVRDAGSKGFDLEIIFYVNRESV